MKLIEAIGNIEVTDSMRDSIDEIAYGVVIAKLKESKERMIHYYENTLEGNCYSIFVVNDRGEDARQIARRIEAYDLILSEYTYGHEPYTFKEVADV